MADRPSDLDRQPSAYSLPDRSQRHAILDAEAIIAAAENIGHSQTSSQGNRKETRGLLIQHGEDGDGYDDSDDGKSEASSRSDQSEEAAGLVSRLSDEDDRANRRARYEGGSRLGSNATHAHSPHRLSKVQENGDYEVGNNIKDADDMDNHGIDRDGVNSAGENEGLNGSEQHVGMQDDVFADRAGTSNNRRRASGRRGTLLARVWEISREALPTLVISLISLVFSGELLIHLARWPVFSKVDKLFILIPILLNLKGNLEGNLSLRMSTSANIGELDVRRTRETLIFGNLSLLQVQALLVSLFASILSFILGIGTSFESGKQGPKAPTPTVSAKPSSRDLSRGSLQSLQMQPRRVIHHHPTTDPSLKLRNSYFEFVMVVATGMLSASLSSAILGSFMCALVVVTRQLGGNPDNIATPLSASLGDLLTLTLLGLLASFLMRFEGTILATLILVGLACACGMFFLFAYRNAYVRELLSSGWIPLILATLISSGAGVVLDTFVQKYEGFALLAPVTTGLPGACAAIFVSRTSTALHAGLGSKPGARGHRRNSSWLRRDFSSHLTKVLRRFTPRWIRSLEGPVEGWLVPLTILSLGVTVTLTFIAFVRLSGQVVFGLPFFLTFGLASLLGMCVALSIAHIFTILLWRSDYDPDIYCLPFVTSLVDVTGQILLVAAFSIAVFFGDTITAAVNDGKR